MLLWVAKVVVASSMVSNSNCLHITCLLLQVVEEVLEKHASLTPLLRTVEEMVCGTASGRAPTCAKFFAHWEAGLHQALHDMILQVPDLLLAAGLCDHSQSRPVLLGGRVAPRSQLLASWACTWHGVCAPG